MEEQSAPTSSGATVRITTQRNMLGEDETSITILPKANWFCCGIHGVVEGGIAGTVVVLRHKEVPS